MIKPKQETPPVKAAGKTVLILETLAGRDRVGVTDIARQTGMSKATAFRFLATLESLGYVRQDGESFQYSVTLKLFELGNLIRSRRSKLDDVKPVLTKLAEETRETVHLATIESGHLVYLDKIESPLSLRVSMMSEIGRSAPLYCTGVGKVLLASLPSDEAGVVLDAINLQRFTPNTITDRTQLNSELRRIRDAGYAVDNEEHEVGVRCIAAAVQNQVAEVVAAVSISVPSVRLTNERFDDYRSKIIDTARTISKIMGPGNWTP